MVCPDLYFQTDPKHLQKCMDIAVNPNGNTMTQGQIVYGGNFQNEVCVTPHTDTNPSVNGHLALYYADLVVGPPYMNPDPPHPMLLGNGNPSGSNNSASATIFPNRSVSITSDWIVPGTPSTSLLIVAQAILDLPIPAGCSPGPSTTYIDLTDRRNAANKFPTVPIALPLANMRILRPFAVDGSIEATANFAFALGEVGDQASLTRVSVSVVERALDRRRTKLVEKYFAKGRWTRGSGVAFALGRERVFHRDAARDMGQGRFGYLGEISSYQRNLLVDGSDCRSETSVSVDVRLEPGELRQGLIEIVVPQNGELSVIAVRHDDLVTRRPLAEFFLIVEDFEQGVVHAVNGSSPHLAESHP